MYPIELYHREKREKLRRFNCAGIPTLAYQMVYKFHAKYKPYVLRFTFDKATNGGSEGGKIINIKQLAINNHLEQFPRNVKRMSSGKRGVAINDEEQRVSQLGEMNIYQSNRKKQIIVCWKFKKEAEMGLTNAYHFKKHIQMKDETLFKRMLDY